jgi:hypothetical protein
MFLLTIILAFVMPLAAPASLGHVYAQGKQDPPIFGEIWARSELYFGTSKPDGTEVSDDEFKKFLDEEVTPRFPDGLTLLTGFGQFRNSRGVIVQERSKLLIILYPLSDATGASDRLEAIRAAYKAAFQQESVLRVDSRAGVSF